MIRVLFVYTLFFFGEVFAQAFEEGVRGGDVGAFFFEELFFFCVGDEHELDEGG